MDLFPKNDAQQLMARDKSFFDCVLIVTWTTNMIIFTLESCSLGGVGVACVPFTEALYSRTDTRYRQPGGKMDGCLLSSASGVCENTAAAHTRYKAANIKN